MSRMGVWFKETATIYRRSTATGWVEAGYQNVGVVKCFIQPSSGAMGTTSGALMPNASYTMFCEADSDIIMGDKVVDAYSKTYVVTSAPKDRGISGIKDHMEVQIEAKNA